MWYFSNTKQCACTHKKKLLFQPVQVVPMGGSGGVGGPENWLNSHSKIDIRP